MLEPGGFDVLLARLAEVRKLDVGALCRLAGVGESELRAVLAGAAPGPALLRRLAPALDLHTADLFAIAGVEVPDDLTPLDPGAGWSVCELVHDAVSMSPKKRGELLERVASLPQRERVERARAHQYFLASPVPGAVLMRLLANRNLSWVSVAKTVRSVSGRYWAASTYGMVGGGRKPLTPDLLADFAALLDVPADVLAALTGIPLADWPSAHTWAITGLAELVWALRRLTADQIEHLRRHVG